MGLQLLIPSSNPGSKDGKRKIGSNGTSPSMDGGFERPPTSGGTGVSPHGCHCFSFRVYSFSFASLSFCLRRLALVYETLLSLDETLLSHSFSERASNMLADLTKQGGTPRDVARF